MSDRLRAQGLDPDTLPGTFQMRPLVYKMFVRQVEKLGIKLEFNRRVVDYFEDERTGKGGAITDDGKRYEADVVIAADGVGSKSQKLVGGQVRARSSGRAMWRAAFPIKHLNENPEVKEFFHLINGTEPIVRTWLGYVSPSPLYSQKQLLILFKAFNIRTHSDTRRFDGMDHESRCKFAILELKLPSNFQAQYPHKLR